MRIKLFMLGCILPMLFACSATGTVPDGAYLRSEFSGGSLSNVVYVFKEGRVAYAATGDLDQFDFAAHAANNAASVGSFTRDGDQMKITWGDGSVQDGEVRLDKSGGFQFYGAPFAPIRPIDDPARLKGRYYGGASYGGVSNAFDLTFDGKGGYQRQQVASLASSSDISEVSGGASHAEAGRYQLSGTRLTLGDEAHWAYEVPTGNPDVVEMLILDGVVVTHED